MIYQEFDLARFIAILISQLIVAIIFLAISYKLLKKSRFRLSLTASSFFILLTFSFILNIVYYPIRNELAINILYKITAFLFLFAGFNLITFKLNLLKSKFEFPLQKQLIYTLIYAAIIVSILLIPGSLTINASTNWRPQWSLWLFFIMLVIVSSFITIPGAIFMIKIYKSLKDIKLKKKWKFYMAGFIILGFILYGWMTSVSLGNELWRTTWNFISLIFILGAILLYFAIASQLKK